MKQPLYAVRDMLIGYMRIYPGINDEAATRDFLIRCEEVNNKQAGDLQLYRVGEFDTTTGKIEACEPEYITGGLTNEQ